MAIPQEHTGQQRPLPTIIQGGMGAGVSDWLLARAVAREGQLGVVSGTALDTVLARRLQHGDPEGHLRRALAAFPWPQMAEAFRDAYLIPGGKAEDAPYRLLPLIAHPLPRERVEALIVANFVEVWLAKEGHDGPVGINYLEKIQLPTIPSLLGAMLAGVDYVLMGGGIPLAIPGLLDGLARWEPVELALHVEGLPAAHAAAARQRLDPREYLPGTPPPLARPRFLAIVSSDIVAKTMLRRARGGGFCGRGPYRGRLQRPTPAPRCGDVDAGLVRRTCPAWRGSGRWLPFRWRPWSSERLAGGRRGCGGHHFGQDESPSRRAGDARPLAVNERRKTDSRPPTGIPQGRLCRGTGRPRPAEARHRICDLGYRGVLTAVAAARYRCRVEPRKAYLAKGAPRSAEGSQCPCNGPMGTIGIAGAGRPAGVAAGDLRGGPRVPGPPGAGRRGGLYRAGRAPLPTRFLTRGSLARRTACG